MDRFTEAHLISDQQPGRPVLPEALECALLVGPRSDSTGAFTNPFGSGQIASGGLEHVAPHDAAPFIDVGSDLNDGLWLWCWQIVEERIRDAQRRLPSQFAGSSIRQLEDIHEEWTECEHDPFDGKKKRFLGLLEKVIEFGHGCRFMDSSKHPELDKEVIAETEKRKKREEAKKK